MILSTTAMSMSLHTKKSLYKKRVHWFVLDLYQQSIHATAGACLNSDTGAYLLMKCTTFSQAEYGL